MNAKTEGYEAYKAGIHKNPYDIKTHENQYYDWIWGHGMAMIAEEENERTTQTETMGSNI